MRRLALLLLLAVQEVPLADVNDFCLQMRDIDLKAVGETKYDLVIVDHSRDAPSASTFVPDDYATLKRSPGGRKTVLGYCSIGSAQTSRFYWKKEWNTAAPDWLGAKDIARRDSFFAKFWAVEWKAIISGQKDSYLDRLIDAGYDGAVLDAIDSYAYWQNRGGVETAREAMIEWLKELSIYVQKRAPRFLLVTVGCEELLTDGRVTGSIHGVLASNVYLREQARRDEADTRRAEELLDAAAKSGTRVFILELTEKKEDVDWVYERARRKGYVPYCGDPQLSKVLVHAGHEPD